MPLTKKGRKIKGAMEKEYGKKKGDEVFYASENSGRIKGVKKYADGGKATRSKDEPEARHNASEERGERRKPSPGMLGSGLAGRAGSALRDRRAEQMKELGLKDGGSVRRAPKRPPMPPPERGKKPERITTANPPGGRRPKRDERLTPRGYKDGGKVVKSSTNC